MRSEIKPDIAQEKLQAYLKAKKQEAKDAGVNFFMGVPDSWYYDNDFRPTFCCQNGHVSNRYLKSEALGANVCLSCMKPVYCCPPDTTEEMLQEVLELKGDSNHE